MSGPIQINNWDTFLEWKTKNNDLSSGIGDIHKISNDLDTTIVDYLLSSGQLNESEVRRIIGLMLAGSVKENISIVYNGEMLSFTVTGGGGNNIIFDLGVDDNINSLFNVWKSTQPFCQDDEGNNLESGEEFSCYTLEDFFNAWIRGPQGVYGVRGLDGDEFGTLRFTLQIYRRTASEADVPRNSEGVVDWGLDDVNNGSSINFSHTGQNSFVAPNGWSKITPDSLSTDPAVANLEKLWTSMTIVESHRFHNASRQYAINDIITHNGKTYKYKYNIQTESSHLDLATQSLRFDPLITSETVLIYDAELGGFKDSFRGTLIPANAYNIIELQLGSDNSLPSEAWDEILPYPGEAPILDWSAPSIIPLAGDGPAGKSLFKVPVYTLTSTTTTGNNIQAPPESPEGGLYDFSLAGELTPPIDPTGVNEWVADHGDATLPGDSTKYSDITDKRTVNLWYAMYTFKADDPTATIHATDDGEPYVLGQNTQLSWGIVDISGQNGMNGLSGQGLRLHKRLTDDEAAIEENPIYELNRDVKVSHRWNWDTDQLELNLPIAGQTVYYRWPQSVEELIDTTYYDQTEFVDTDRVGAVLPNLETDDKITLDDNFEAGALFINDLVTKQKIAFANSTLTDTDSVALAAACLPFKNINPKYDGFYLGSPTAIIDETSGWFFLTPPRFRDPTSNLYTLYSNASTRVGESYAPDTTLFWTPFLIKNAKSSANYQTPLDGQPAQEIKTIEIWTRKKLLSGGLDQQIAPNSPKSADCNATHRFSFMTPGGTMVPSGKTINETDITTAVIGGSTLREGYDPSGNDYDWWDIIPNNHNRLGLLAGETWVDGDPYWKATADVLKPPQWKKNESYPLDFIVHYYGKTYKCIKTGGTGSTSTDLFGPDNPAVASMHAPNVSGSVDWQEYKAHNVSGVYSVNLEGGFAIPDESWEVQNQSVGNEGPVGPRGSTMHSGNGDPTLSEPNNDGLWVLDGLLFDDGIDRQVYAGDTYLDKTDGEMWQISETFPGSAVLEATSLWSIDLQGIDYNWVWRTWNLPDSSVAGIGTVRSTEVIRDLAKTQIEAEIAAAQVSHPYKQVGDSWDQYFPDVNTGNGHQGGEWSTAPSSFDPATQYQYITAISHYRGGEYPTSWTNGSPPTSSVWDTATTVPGYGNPLVYHSLTYATNQLDSESFLSSQFFGTREPDATVDPFNIHGICSGGKFVNGAIVEPVACTAAQALAGERRDVSPAWYATIGDNNEQLWHLGEDGVWVQTVQSLRGDDGTDGNLLETLYWTAGRTVEQGPPPMLGYTDPVSSPFLQFVDQNGNNVAKVFTSVVDPELSNTANTGGVYGGWSLIEPSENGKLVYKIHGTKHHASTSDRPWRWTFPVLDRASFWFYSSSAGEGPLTHFGGSLGNGSNSSGQYPRDGDLYIQTNDGTNNTAGAATLEMMWSFSSSTDTWKLMLTDIQGNKWWYGAEEPADSNSGFAVIPAVPGASLANPQPGTNRSAKSQVKNGDIYLQTAGEEVSYIYTDNRTPEDINAGIGTTPIWTDNGALKGVDGQSGTDTNAIFTLKTIAAKPNTPGDSTGLVGEANTLPYVRGHGYQTSTAERWLDLAPELTTTQTNAGVKLWTSFGKATPSTDGSGSLNWKWQNPILFTGPTGATGEDGAWAKILHRNTATDSSPAKPASNITKTSTSFGDWKDNYAASTNEPYSWISTGNTVPTSTNPNLFVWDSPIRTSGRDGENSTVAGPSGERGTIMVRYSNTTMGITNTLSNSDKQYKAYFYWKAACEAQYGTTFVSTNPSSNPGYWIYPGDQIQLTSEGTTSGSTITMIFTHNSRIKYTSLYANRTKFSEVKLFVDGSAIIKGTLSVDALYNGTSDASNTVDVTDSGSNAIGKFQISNNSELAGSILGTDMKSILHSTASDSTSAAIWGKNTKGGWTAGFASLGHGGSGPQGSAIYSICSTRQDHLGAGMISSCILSRPNRGLEATFYRGASGENMYYADIASSASGAGGKFVYYHDDPYHHNTTVKIASPGHTYIGQHFSDDGTAVSQTNLGSAHYSGLWQQHNWGSHGTSGIQYEIGLALGGKALNSKTTMEGYVPSKHAGWGSDTLHSIQMAHWGQEVRVGILQQLSIRSETARNELTHYNNPDSETTMGQPRPFVGMWVSTSDGSTHKIPDTKWDALRTYGGNIRIYGGNMYDFTGAHDTVISKYNIPEIGDILIDQSVLGVSGISGTVTQSVRSTTVKQKGSGGVFNGNITTASGVRGGSGPTALIEEIPWTDEELEDESKPTSIPLFKLRDEHSDLFDNNIIVGMNAVGEGQINVCGENGDFEAGDLIVTSSTPGKGMKQDDDIIRSYTVAKVREAVTFSDPAEVKLVACVYLCG